MQFLTVYIYIYDEKEVCACSMGNLVYIKRCQKQIKVAKM
jgi:hypothetical protein